MPKHNIPTYAIVELLMRLSPYNASIGDYKGHTVRLDNVLVKTSNGSIVFTKALIMQQFGNPEQISEEELVTISSLFKALPLKQKTIS